MGLPTLAARAKNTAYKNAVNQWRRSLPGFGLSSNNLSRPNWTKSVNKGGKTSYLHLYSRDLLATEASPHTNLGEHWARAAASFHELPQETREKYKRDSQLRRSVSQSSQLPPLARAATQTDDVVEGPLGIASRTGMPIRASALAEHQRNTSFAKTCANWTKAHKSKSEADVDFPDTVQGVRVCHGEKCTQSMFDDESEESMRADVAHLFEYIRLVLLYFPAKNACADPMFLLQFVSDVERHYVLVVHPQHLNQSRFTAEFMMLRPDDVSDAASFSDTDAVHALPMHLALAPGRVVMGVTWPHISDELQFVSRLLQTGSEWTISNMTKSISGVGQWLVTDQTVVSFDDAKEREAEVKEQQASLAAMKKAMGLTGHKASGRVRGRRNKRKPKTEDALLAQTSKNKKKGGNDKPLPSSDSTGSVDTDEQTSCDEHWKDILTSLHKGRTSRTRATDAPPADDEARGPLAGDEAHDETRGPSVIAGERVIEEHGLAVLSEVWSNGVLEGFGITCRGHHDCHEKPGTICKKQLSLGKSPMSHEEAKLRLKRWYVAGLHETFDPQTARSSHIKFGGRALHQLRSGKETGWCTISEEDLNEMARRGKNA